MSNQTLEQKPGESHSQVSSQPEEGQQAKPRSGTGGLGELVAHPAIGKHLMKIAMNQIESGLKNDKTEPNLKKEDPEKASESFAQVTLNVNKHLPPVQVNLHQNQAPTASFAPAPPAMFQPTPQFQQQQPPPPQNMGIDIQALLGMFCGGRPNQPPQAAPHIQTNAPTQAPAPVGAQNPQQPMPDQGTIPQVNQANQQNSGMFGFLKNLPFMGPSSQQQAPSGQPDPNQQTSSSTVPGTSKPPLVFHRPEGTKENELILLPQGSNLNHTGEATVAVPSQPAPGQQPVPNDPSVRNPFQPTVPAGAVPQQVQPTQPAPFIDLGSLLNMFCGGHNNQHPQQPGQPGAPPTNQRQGFNLNFFRNFSFSGQAQHGSAVNPQTQQVDGHQPHDGTQTGTNLAAVGTQLLSSIEYRQNQGLSLNLGNLVNGLPVTDVYGQLQAVQQENTELKERLTQLEQERKSYVLPAANIGMDFGGYQELVEEVNTYCKEFKQELTQAQLDYINRQLKQSFEERLSGLFKEVKLNTKEELDLFLSHGNKTLASLKAVHEDLALRLKEDALVLDLKDKSRLLDPLEQQISTLERRIKFFASERYDPAPPLSPIPPIEAPHGESVPPS